MWKRVSLVLALHLACVGTRLGPGGTRGSPSSSPGPMLRIDGREYALSVCRSGDREYFLGVDLADTDRTAVLRVLIDPMDGPRLRLTSGGGGAPRVMALGPDSCRTLQAEVQPTGWRVNRVRDFSGFVMAECTAASGQEVRAEVRFAHCH